MHPWPWLIVRKCGGFLSDQWLGKEEPDLYSGSLTPSQRKVSQYSRRRARLAD